jgi:hypothetical protein
MADVMKARWRRSNNTRLAAEAGSSTEHSVIKMGQFWARLYI